MVLLPGVRIRNAPFLTFVPADRITSDETDLVPCLQLSTTL